MSSASSIRFLILYSFFSRVSPLSFSEEFCYLIQQCYYVVNYWSKGANGLRNLILTFKFGASGLICRIYFIFLVLGLLRL
jgi:hypothetical protein